MSKWLVIFSVCLIPFILTNCKSSEQISTHPGSIQGDWQLVTINPSGGEQMPVSENSRYTLSFNTDGTIAGLADCRLFAGTYKAKTEGVLNINNFNSNNVKCAADSKASAYLVIAQKSISFQVMGNKQLTVSTNDGAQLIFARKPDMQSAS